MKLPSRIPPWVALAIGGTLVVGGIVAALASGVNYADVRGFLEQLNPAMLLAFMAILPVFGFSIGAVYLIAGARFGLVGGGVVVAAVTSIHLLLTHAIARSLLREPIEKLLSRHRHHLPEIPHGAEISVAVMLVLVPGLPYFARNCLLAISGIPLRTYFAVCMPIYVIRSYLSIYIGDFGMKPSTNQFLIIAAIFVVKLAICAALLQHLRKRFYRHQKA